MDYSISQLAALAGISTRTLRHYDHIGLLVPKRCPSTGYRIYSGPELDKLQQILLYRAMGLELSAIATLLDATGADPIKTLADHRSRLLDQITHLQALLALLDKTLAYHKGDTTMTDEEKFAALKTQALEQNEQTYGTEIRHRYGISHVEAANKQFLAMDAQESAAVAACEQQLFEALVELAGSGDLDSATGKAVYELHKTWLCNYWPTYTAEAHRNLGIMYAEDPRFAAYYNQRAGMEVATWLRDAILRHAG